MLNLVIEQHSKKIAILRAKNTRNFRIYCLEFIHVYAVKSFLGANLQEFFFLLAIDFFLENLFMNNVFSYENILEMSTEQL